ncbi:DUF6894 family protein [Chthonobacter rhizosphaerae]|uniref:DUF6894 family protein n=1 Tax=Chthonobacter rhizosphaerae TaxID=2735553 RepID=UPI003CCD6E31
MARYFFDVRLDAGGWETDLIGTKVDTLEVAQEAAERELADLDRSEFPGSLAITIRIRSACGTEVAMLTRRWAYSG